jgi:hypothetical protein
LYCSTYLNGSNKAIDPIFLMRYNNKKWNTEEEDDASKFEDPFGKR